MGSGELIGTLMQHRIVDEFMLIIHPIVLGHGRRLFTDNAAHTTLELDSAKPTTSGVIIATYRSIGQ